MDGTTTLPAVLRRAGNGLSNGYQPLNGANGACNPPPLVVNANGHTSPMSAAAAATSNGRIANAAGSRTLGGYSAASRKKEFKEWYV